MNLPNTIVAAASSLGVLQATGTLPAELAGIGVAGQGAVVLWILTQIMGIREELGKLRSEIQGSDKR